MAQNGSRGATHGGWAMASKVKVGEKFGRWTVIGEAERDKGGRQRWLCRCECGREKPVETNHLNSRASQSCGCLSAERATERQSKAEVGHHYGRLTVIERSGQQNDGKWLWRCRCNCGSECIVLGKDLRSGNTQSCGCLRRELASTQHLVDEVGHRFGKLIVVCRAGNDYPVRWRCRCDCGNETIVRAEALRSGNTRSCGCLHELPFGVSALRSLYKSYIHGAQQRDLAFALTIDDFRELTGRECHYCGVRPSLEFANGRREDGSPRGNGGYTYNGLDRVDTSMGYTLDNVVPCCFQCNTAKFTSTLQEFAYRTKRIYEHWAIHHIESDNRNHPTLSMKGPGRLL